MDINSNVYGLNSQLASQLERLGTEKNEELQRLADECEALRAKNETLEADLRELGALLAESEQDRRAEQEETQRLHTERDAHIAQLQAEHEAKNTELARLINERDTYQSQANETIARLRAEHDTSQREAIQRIERERDAVVADKNAQLAQLQQKHDEQAQELDVMTRIVLPRVFDKFTRDAANNMDKVHRLDAKYAQLSSEMEARSREMATRSAELNEEKNEFVETFTKQCDGYKAMADALRDRSIKVDLSTILKSIGVSREPEQELAPQPEPTIPDDAASDKLKSLSLNWRRN